MVNVQQSTPPFNRRSENFGDRNLFDLSHDHKTTFTMGKLIPFLCLETLPSDTFFISGEFMLRFAPLYLPIMHRVNMSVDYFYVPNRILWPGIGDNSWEYFIKAEDSVPPPHFVLDNNSSFTTVQEYMGFPSQLSGAAYGIPFPLNAFPLSAYLKIYDEYYRNAQLQDEKWFPLTSGDNTASFEEALGLLFVPIYRNWNRDYYTSATLTPQIGETLVPLINPNLALEDPAIFGPSTWLYDDGLVANGDLFANTTSGTIVGGLKAMLNIQETAPTIQQLRYSVVLAEYLERLMRAGDRYRDVIEIFWDVDPQPNTVDRPVFIGGLKGRVVVSEVMSTAETLTSTNTVSSYVGSYGGQALALESQRNQIEHFCTEHGHIIGIISVYPNSSYMQGMERMWWKRNTKLDYAWPQFALIGDDAILNKEVNFSYTALLAEWNESVFGYQKRYAEYMYHNDIYSGQMRDNFISYHLGRIFVDGADADEVVLDSEFIQCRPDVTRVFQVVEGEDEIYAHIYNEVKVLRRLPKSGIPRL